MGDPLEIEYIKSLGYKLSGVLDDNYKVYSLKGYEKYYINYVSSTGEFWVGESYHEGGFDVIMEHLNLAEDFKLWKRKLLNTMS